MVSNVMCQRHPGGSQPGILACSHISTEAATLSVPRPFRILVDDTELQVRRVVLACPACCDNFKLSVNQPVPGDIFWNESSFPYVAPICSRCAVDVGFVSDDDKDAV